MIKDDLPGDTMLGTDTRTCSHGHHWPATLEALTCPVCGEVASSVPAAPFTEQPTVSLAGGDDLDDLLDDSPPALGAPAGNTHFTAPGDTPTPHLARDSVPGYEIEGELGRGGMGVVYRARQRGLNRTVALKMILAGAHAGSAERERFRAEAEAVAALQHPNIVQVYEVGEAGSHPYLAFEFVDGGSLSARLTGNPWPARDAAHLVATLADAMHYAHQRGIVHRDLKPANVLMSADQPKVTDFGLAKRLAEAHPELTDGNTHPAKVDGLTRTGAVVGTPSYIAPEQAGGRLREIGPATDVYALGAILYELLTGRPPFRGETPMDTILQVLTDDPVPVRRLSPKCPRDLETIALKCLAKVPGRRYARASELAADLRRFTAGEPILARPVGPAEKVAKWMRRRPAIASLTVLSALLAVGVVVGSLLVSVTLQAARDNEAREKRSALLQKERADRERQKAEDNQRRAEEQTRLADSRVEQLLHSQYALELTRIAALAERDPSRAVGLLADEQRCPPRFRDFTWGLLAHRTRRELMTLEGHEKGVNAVAVSPAGVVASASWDRTVRLWDSRTGAVLAILAGHDGHVLGVAFSPDARWLATASNDRTVRLWDVSAFMGEPKVDARGEAADLKPAYSLVGHTDSVMCVAFSPDGQTLASSGHDPSVRRWDLSALPRAEQAKKADAEPAEKPVNGPIKELEPFKAHEKGVAAVAFSSNGRYLASAGADSVVYLWDATRAVKPIMLAPKGGFRDAVTALTFSPDGQTLAVGCNSLDRIIRLWDVRTVPAGEPRELKGHTLGVYALSFAPDGRTLASSSGDGTVRLWQTAGNPESTVLTGHRGTVSGVAFCPNGQFLASGGGDQTVRLWLPGNRREETFNVEVKRDQRTPVALIDGDVSILAVNEPGGGVRVWGLSGRGELAQLTGHAGPVSAMTQAGRWLVTAGSEDKTVRGYDIGPCLKGDRPGKEPLRARLWFGKTTRAAQALALSPDARLLAVGDGPTIRLFDVGSEKEVRSWEAHPGQEVRALVFGPDDRTLASGGSDQEVRLWQTADGKSRGVLTSHTAALRALAFTPDGESLASIDDLGDGRLWTLPETGEATERARFGDRDAPATTLHFSADGQALATGHRDRSVRLRDPLTGQERAALTGHTDGVLLLRFGVREGTAWMVSVSEAGEVKRWSAGE